MKEFDAITAALGIEHATNMLAGLGFNQRNLETHHLVEIAVEAPVEHPGRLHSEDRGGAVVGSLELGDPSLGGCRCCREGN